MTYNITSQPVNLITDTLDPATCMLNIYLGDGSSLVLYNNCKVDVYSAEYKLVLTRSATEKEKQLMRDELRREEEEKERLKLWEEKYRGLPGVDEPDLSFEDNFSDLF
ncbi:MAG: hypothetical protein J6C50_00320 [Rickettsiales bacterium]|nr:hypothetical protein [Rickettsiales bacterium]